MARKRKAAAGSQGYQDKLALMDTKSDQYRRRFGDVNPHPFYNKNARRVQPAPEWVVKDDKTLSNPLEGARVTALRHGRGWFEADTEIKGVVSYIRDLRDNSRYATVVTDDNGIKWLVDSVTECTDLVHPSQMTFDVIYLPATVDELRQPANMTVIPSSVEGERAAA